MKANNGRAHRSSVVLAVMGLLALCAIGLTWVTAKNYLNASTAAARFHIAVSEITCEQENSEYVLGIGVDLRNQSKWDLSIISMRAIVYIDRQYVWGQNYDFMSNRLELPQGSERDTVLRIEVPYTKKEIVNRGGDNWSIRVSGLLDMPYLGSKLFVTHALIPLEGGHD